MKKVLSMLIVLTLLMGCSVVFAEGDMSVQIIHGPTTETEPVSLDDLKINAIASIEGYAEVLVTSFSFADILGYYDDGGNYNTAWGWEGGRGTYQSGNDAEFAILKVDLTNTSTLSKDFLSQCSVKVVYDDVYEYAGWARQYNYDFHAPAGDKVWGGKANKECVIQKVDQFEIGPWYAGHYAFGCTLPNAVVNSKKPLRMVITIDGNEITYNIRK